MSCYAEALYPVNPYKETTPYTSHSHATVRIKKMTLFQYSLQDSTDGFSPNHLRTCADISISIIIVRTINII